MLERALAAGMPTSWVTADEAYGQDSLFRSWLEVRRVGYVVAVPKSQPVPTSTTHIGALAAAAPEQAWKTRSAGDGAKGQRLFDWASATLPQHPDHPSDLRRWALIRCSRSSGELAYYLCFGPADTTNTTPTKPTTSDNAENITKCGWNTGVPSQLPSAFCSVGGKVGILKVNAASNPVDQLGTAGSAL